MKQKDYELTEAQEILYEGLKIFLPNRKTDRIIIMLMLEEEAQQIEMLKYMKDNMEATPEQIIAEAQRIANQESPSPNETPMH